ncbi:Chloroperoxidase [Irpex rosettiformis]|uniref:Chloroperoxidase n=1 Tax=Irpex rosettiformis TaxID=378272 RepID=A0ACB8UEM3_9APHY|nr:Chloroperoxidase [Irpex rosettiformis]
MSTSSIPTTPTEKTPLTSVQEDHAYQHSTKRESRSPCPALNAMANHGYLPRDGRGIGMFQMAYALREVYNLSLPLAFFLTIVGFILCAPWWPFHWTINLHDLSRHNQIEHNCSLCHADAKPGAEFAPWHVSFTLLHRLLGTTSSGYLNIDSFVEARIQRARDDPKPLCSVHREIAHGEAALTMLVLGQRLAKDSPDEKLVVPYQFIQQWFGCSRLPEGWKKPEKEIGLFEAGWLSRNVKKAIEKRRAQLDRILEKSA